MIETLETYAGINLIHHLTSDGTVWGTRNRKILRKRAGETWVVVAQFPFQGPKDLLEVTRLTARASRVDQSNLYVNSPGRILGIRNGVVYRIEEGSPPVQLGEIHGDSILRRGIAEDSEGGCYFGEYFQNQDRGSVRIWKADPDLSTIEVAYEFPARTLRHVHGIHSDPYDSGVFWVTVGDDDGTDPSLHDFVHLFDNGAEPIRQVVYDVTECSPGLDRTRKDKSELDVSAVGFAPPKQSRRRPAGVDPLQRLRRLRQYRQAAIMMIAPQGRGVADIPPCGRAVAQEARVGPRQILERLVRSGRQGQEKRPVARSFRGEVVIG